jgi:haloacid dehalogenase-like hydrolase
VRREYLIEAGRRVRLKNNVDLLAQYFEAGLDGYEFPFYVVSASPQNVVQSALEGLVPADRVFGTQLDFDETTGEVSAITRVSAGYGKVAVLQELESRLQVTPDHRIYMGDGSSDLFVMLHVNSREGYTIAVSEAKFIGRIANRTVLSDSALSVFGPDSGGHTELDIGTDTRTVRIVRSVASRVGQDSHGLVDLPARGTAASRRRSRSD